MRPLGSNKEGARFDEELDSEIVILHAQDDLIEKSLGIDESIIVATTSLIAFEDGIQFTEVPIKSMASSDRSKFVRV